MSEENVSSYVQSNFCPNEYCEEEIRASLLKRICSSKADGEKSFKCLACSKKLVVRKVGRYYGVRMK